MSRPSLSKKLPNPDIPDTYISLFNYNITDPNDEIIFYYPEWYQYINDEKDDEKNMYVSLEYMKDKLRQKFTTDRTFSNAITKIKKNINKRHRPNENTHCT